MRSTATRRLDQRFYYPFFEKQAVPHFHTAALPDNAAYLDPLISEYLNTVGGYSGGRTLAGGRGALTCSVGPRTYAAQLQEVQETRGPRCGEGSERMR